MSDSNHFPDSVPSTIATWWKQNQEKQLLDQLRRADAARLPPEPVTLGDPHAAPFLLASMQGYLGALGGDVNEAVLVCSSAFMRATSSVAEFWHSMR